MAEGRPQPSLTIPQLDVLRADSPGVPKHPAARFLRLGVREEAVAGRADLGDTI